MKGHEHYAEAERLAELAAKLTSQKAGAPAPTIQALSSLAQAHATLALAAATALPTVAHYMGDDRVVTDWADAIGHQRGGPSTLEEVARA